MTNATNRRPYTDADVQAAVAAACRAWPDTPKPIAAVVGAAVLETVAPAIAARVLRKYADSLIAELVCCDIYDGKGTGAGHGHEICYWGGAAAQGARDEADELEARAADGMHDGDCEKRKGFVNCTCTARADEIEVGR